MSLARAMASRMGTARHPRQLPSRDVILTPRLVESGPDAAGRAAGGRGDRPRALGAPEDIAEAVGVPVVGGVVVHDRADAGGRQWVDDPLSPRSRGPARVTVTGRRRSTSSGTIRPTARTVMVAASTDARRPRRSRSFSRVANERLRRPDSPFADPQTTAVCSNRSPPTCWCSTWRAVPSTPPSSPLRTCGRWWASTSRAARARGPRLREAGIDNVLLQEGNATALPFVDASFDLVFCRTALHHMAEPGRSGGDGSRLPPGGPRRGGGHDGARCRGARQLRRPAPGPRPVAHPRAARRRAGGAAGAACRSSCTRAALHGLVSVCVTRRPRHPVMAPLRAELDGGPPSGFLPVADGEQVHVRSPTPAVHATKAPA